MALAVLAPAATSSTAERETRGSTQRVSVGPDGQQGNAGSWYPAVSAGGRFVVFDSNTSNLVAGDTNGLGDVFVRDRRLKVTLRVSVGPNGRQADNEDYGPVMTADGRSVVFWSYATNLVDRDTNGAEDVFVRDR